MPRVEVSDLDGHQVELFASRLHLGRLRLRVRGRGRVRVRDRVRVRVRFGVS